MNTVESRIENIEKLLEQVWAEIIKLAEIDSIMAYGEWESNQQTDLDRLEELF